MEREISGQEEIKGNYIQNKNTHLTEHKFVQKNECLFPTEKDNARVQAAAAPGSEVILLLF